MKKINSQKGQGKSQIPKNEEQAVILTIQSQGGGFYKEVKMLEEEIEHQLFDGAELDGDEFSEDEATIYLYGLDADRILSSIKNVLTEFSSDVAVTVRYGEASNTNSVERKYIL